MLDWDNCQFTWWTVQMRMDCRSEIAAVKDADLKSESSDGCGVRTQNLKIRTVAHTSDGQLWTTAYIFGTWSSDHSPLEGTILCQRCSSLSRSLAQGRIGCSSWEKLVAISQRCNVVTLLGLLDLSAAFDCVDHEILLARLECKFVENGDFRFFRSLYLPNLRMQCHNYYTVLCSPLVACHWHRNRWPWVTLNGHFALKCV